MTSPGGPGEITRLLRAHHEGDREAFDRLVPLVYDRLRRIARGQLARGGRGATLDTSALVHDAWVQLVDEDGVAWQDRGHFFAVCTRAMRRLVVDHARRHAAGKRGGGAPPVTLRPEHATWDDQAELVLAIDEILERLAAFNERLVRVVECRYFSGMTEAETGEALGMPLRTVQRDWTRARAWLHRELGGR